MESGSGAEGAVMQVVEMRVAGGGTEGFHGRDLGRDDGRWQAEPSGPGRHGRRSYELRYHTYSG
jgi:hypothetical protein